MSAKGNFEISQKYQSHEAAEKYFWDEQNTPENTGISMEVDPMDVVPVTTKKLIEIVMLLPEEDQLRSIICYFADIKRSVNIASAICH